MNIFKTTLDTRHQNGVIGPITQFDNATLELQILSGGQVTEPWNSPEFELIAMKRDMNPVREVDQDKFIILSKEDHKVRIELKEQFLTCRGTVKMQLVIKDGSRLSTTIFYLSVAQSLDHTIVESLKDIKVLDDLDEVVESLSTFEVTATNNEAKRQHNEKLREVAESNRQDEFDKAQNQRDTEFNEKMEEYQDYVSGLQGIQGKPGETPQIQVNETHIQIKYPSQQEWTDLIALDRLKGSQGLQGLQGKQGDPGEQGIQGLPGKDGANGRDGATPNFTIGTVTTLEPGEQAMVTIRGDKENPILDIAIPRGADGKDGQGRGGGGEKLVVNYTHSGNKEIYFSQIEYKTGIATTTEPHGITAKTEIMIVPNNWTLDATSNENLSVPIEWTTHNTRITVTPVDENKLLVANNTGNAIIPVNLEDVSNGKVDCTKFHFEIPIGWKFTNIPEKILRFRLIKKGYIKGCGQYRYVRWGIECDNNRVMEPAYLNPLGTPNIGYPPTTHCIFGIEDWIVDARDYSIIFERDSLFFGRRKGYSHLVWDSVRESTKYTLPSYNIAIGRHKPVRLDNIGTYSAAYAYMANGTSIKLYDLGGNDNEK